jgi:hypothetical protein
MTYNNDLGHDENHHVQPSHIAASSEEASSPGGAASSAPSSASHEWNALDGEPHHAGFSPFVAFCFTINFILGTGFLTIPWYVLPVPP